MAKSVTLKNSNGDTLYPVTDASLINGSLQASQIPANSITTDRIYDGAVTTAKIDDGAVMAAKIADGTLTQDKFDLDEFPAGTVGYYFESNKTSNNQTTGTNLGGNITITCSKPVRVMFKFSALMKTSRYTSNLGLKIDGSVVASGTMNSTANTTIVSFHVATLSAGSHTVNVCIRSQDSGTTATAIAYNQAINSLAWWCV